MNYRFLAIAVHKALPFITSAHLLRACVLCLQLHGTPGGPTFRPLTRTCVDPVARTSAPCQPSVLTMSRHTTPAMYVVENRMVCGASITLSFTHFIACSCLPKPAVSHTLCCQLLPPPPPYPNPLSPGSFLQVCWVLCDSAPARTAHMSSMHPTCGVCGDSCLNPRALEEHMATFHPPKECPVQGCGKVLRGTAALNAHVSNDHVVCR